MRLLLLTVVLGWSFSSIHGQGKNVDCVVKLTESVGSGQPFKEFGYNTMVHVFSLSVRLFVVVVVVFEWGRFLLLWGIGT